MPAALTADMAAAVVCREMKWTFEDYQDQPAHFVDTIVEMLKAESREVERRNKKQWPNQSAN